MDISGSWLSARGCCERAQFVCSGGCVHRFLLDLLWFLAGILFCSSLTAKATEHLFTCFLAIWPSHLKGHFSNLGINFSLNIRLYKSIYYFGYNCKTQLFVPESSVFHTATFYEGAKPLKGKRGDDLDLIHTGFPAQIPAAAGRGGDVDRKGNLTGGPREGILNIWLHFSLKAAQCVWIKKFPRLDIGEGFDTNGKNPSLEVTVGLCPEGQSEMGVINWADFHWHPI